MLVLNYYQPLSHIYSGTTGSFSRVQVLPIQFLFTEVSLAFSSFLHQSESRSKCSIKLFTNQKAEVKCSIKLSANQKVGVKCSIKLSTNHNVGVSCSIKLSTNQNVGVKCSIKLNHSVVMVHKGTNNNMCNLM